MSIARDKLLQQFQKEYERLNTAQRQAVEAQNRRNGEEFAAVRAEAEELKAEKAAILIREPWFPDKDPAFLARETGLVVHEFAPSCAGPEAGAYWRHFEDMVGALAPGG